MSTFSSENKNAFKQDAPVKFSGLRYCASGPGGVPLLQGWACNSLLSPALSTRPLGLTSCPHPPHPHIPGHPSTSLSTHPPSTHTPVNVLALYNYPLSLPLFKCMLRYTPHPCACWDTPLPSACWIHPSNPLSVDRRTQRQVDYKKTLPSTPFPRWIIC